MIVSKKKIISGKKGRVGTVKARVRKNSGTPKTGARKKKTDSLRASRIASKGTAIALKRFEGNPIIEPLNGVHWESKATFNPSAIYGDGKVHIIYRAIGDGDVSMFGYAKSSDGLVFEREPRPVFYQMASSLREQSYIQIPYSSGGGWNGGSEDPRLTRINSKVYMLYTAFDGWGSIRIALTSISFDDFVRGRWNWKAPVYISPPGEVHKNWVLFPERIKGKYAILHSISPRILIDYVNDLDEFDGTKFLRSSSPNGVGYEESWDNWPRGAGPAPLKTKYGWLLLYHAMDVNDPNRYKLGAMLLDLNDPTKILYRARAPILEPDETYENEGYKTGVVYACGAVIVDERLFVYYGGADRVTCVAVAEVEPFLKSIMSSGETNLKRTRARK